MGRTNCVFVQCSLQPAAPWRIRVEKTGSRLLIVIVSEEIKWGPCLHSLHGRYAVQGGYREIVFRLFLGGEWRCMYEEMRSVNGWLHVISSVLQHVLALAWSGDIRRLP